MMKMSETSKINRTAITIAIQKTARREAGSGFRHLLGRAARDVAEHDGDRGDHSDETDERNRDLIVERCPRVLRDELRLMCLDQIDDQRPDDVTERQSCDGDQRTQMRRHCPIPVLESDLSLHPALLPGVWKWPAVQGDELRIDAGFDALRLT